MCGARDVGLVETSPKQIASMEGRGEGLAGKPVSEERGMSRLRLDRGILS